jgi:hypothetical protein
MIFARATAISGIQMKSVLFEEMGANRQYWKISVLQKPMNIWNKAQIKTYALIK